MVRHIAVLVDEGRGGIVLRRFETAFAKNLADALAPGFISGMNPRPVDRPRTVLLILFGEGLELLGAKGLSLGVLEASSVTG